MESSYALLRKPNSPNPCPWPELLRDGGWPNEAISSISVRVAIRISPRPPFRPPPPRPSPRYQCSYSSSEVRGTFDPVFIANGAGSSNNISSLSEGGGGTNVSRLRRWWSGRSGVGGVSFARIWASSATGHRSGDGSGLGGNAVSLVPTAREPARGRVGMRDGRGVVCTAGDVDRDGAGVKSLSNGRGVECVRGRVRGSCSDDWLGRGMWLGCSLVDRASTGGRGSSGVGGSDMRLDSARDSSSRP